jgi:hypothetical protein
VFEEYFQWIEQRQGLNDGDHAVGVKMSAVKLRESNPETYPWGHGSYAEGRLGWHGNDLTGRLKVLFSDRRTADGDRFDRGKADVQDVTVSRDGRVRITLVTWGNTELVLERVTAQGNGLFNGIVREGNGVSLVTLLLRKEVMRPDRDGFRDWP